MRLKLRQGRLAGGTVCRRAVRGLASGGTEAPCVRKRGSVEAYYAWRLGRGVFLTVALVGGTVVGMVK
jgi:hypothetical protein